MSLCMNVSVVFVDESEINDSNEDNLFFLLLTKTHIHITSSQHEFAD